MPRQARKKSATDIYHIMMRGINKQEIFHDAEDFRKFQNTLRKFKPVCGYEIYAYCLMPNHVHMLMRAGDESIGHAIQRISSSYVYWYNLKYQRVGHLFQGRYRSEAVENDRYFMTALRYIIQNPMKAGMERLPGSYPWSSYFSYAGYSDGITDNELVIDIFGSQKGLLQFLDIENSDSGLDITETRQGVTDEDALRIIAEVTGHEHPVVFKSIDKSMQREYVQAFMKRNLSESQISRLMGIPRTSLRRILY